MYCTDSDLHRWEPALAHEAAAAAQTLLSAQAILHGDTLTLLDGACLDETLLCEHHVIDLVGDDAVRGCYGILGLDRARNTCTVRRFPAQLDERQGDDRAYPVEVSFRTFALLRQTVSETLHWVGPGELQTRIEAGQNLEPLRRPAALGTLHLIYAGLNATRQREDADLQIRTELYGRLYRRALRELTNDAPADADAIFGARRDD